MFEWSGENEMSDDIHTLLAAAAADVEKAGVPDDLRAAAFTAAVALRSGPAPAVPAGEGAATPPRNTEEWQSTVAAAMGVEAEDIDEAFDLAGGEMHVAIGPSRLPSHKAAAMRDVALLICTARQAAGLEEDGFTSVSVVRDECRDLGVLDGGNFATEISGLDDFLSFRGSGRSRSLKVNRRGIEEAGQRLREILRRD